MNTEKFYRRLFSRLETELGSIDPDTIFAIMGFDGGGPLNFNTIGAQKGAQFVTYVSCELALRNEQKPSKFGRYELLTSCNDEDWVRKRLSDIGRMSMTTTFGHGHTLDFGSFANANESIQGVIFEKVYDTKIDGRYFGILRCIGITRTEMEYGLQCGSASLFAKLKEAGIYPHTDVNRRSIS
ncbi:MAG TPA: suppressor of fused domain protein [Phycisphaerae bacterium]|nr:suppressor of fused domain protein [Phycisphaerae bacterium]